MNEKKYQFPSLLNIAQELSAVFNMQKEYEKLTDERSILRKKIEMLQFALEDSRMLKEKNKRLETELSDLKANFSHFFELQEEVSEYRQKYLPLKNAYQLYKSLPDEVQAKYASVVDASSPLAFLVSGSDIENINLYYENVCMEWEKYQDDVLEKLNQVFDFLFEQFRVNHSDYTRIQTNTGEAFNLESHIRTADSPPVGNISKIIIAGFGNGNKLKKSFVKLG